MANVYWNGSTDDNSDVAANWEDVGGSPYGNTPQPGDHAFMLGARIGAGDDTCDSFSSGAVDVSGGYTEDAAYAAKTPGTLTGDPSPLAVIGGVATVYAPYVLTSLAFEVTELRLHANMTADGWFSIGELFIYDDKQFDLAAEAVSVGGAILGDIHLMSAGATLGLQAFISDIDIDDGNLVIPSESTTKIGTSYGFSADSKAGSLVVPRRVPY